MSVPREEPVMLQKKGGKDKKDKKDKKAKEVKEEEPEVCSVCSDKYTSIIRKRVECKYCHAATCSKCIEQYLLGRAEDAHCLHCRVNYNDAALYDICTKTYLTSRYFKHRQEVLVSREKANLPGLQHAATLELKRRALQKRIGEMHLEINQMKEKRGDAIIEYSRLCNLHYAALKEGKPSIYQAQLDESAATAEAYRVRIQEKMYEAREMRWENIEEKEEKEEERKKFIRRCTNNGCQGFLSTAWKCGICEFHSCSKCFMVKGKEHDVAHECKKEDVETAELIKKDSKPCPNCGEFIMKSSGCSQMYCICCHTPFDWNTGKIVTSGPIHNPHYYEWMKRNGGAAPRNPADVPCGGFPDRWQIVPFPRGLSGRTSNIFYEFHRICQELQDISTRNYRSHLDITNTNHINVRFLTGDYDEKKWGQLLALNEKRRKRDAEIQEVLAAFRMVAVDIINQVQNYADDVYPQFSKLPVALAETFLWNLDVQIQGLFTMINDAIRLVSITHNQSVPYLRTIHCKETRLNFYNVATKNFAGETRKKRGAAEAESDDEDVEPQNDVVLPHRALRLRQEYLDEREHEAEEEAEDVLLQQALQASLQPHDK